MTLIIMAAGIGSRFGKGIKQLQKVDGAGHIIMDYSIHDALAAGFTRIVFIIRKEIEEEFRAAIGHRIEAVCQKAGASVGYAFQSMPDPATGRTKPYGTGHAVLACRDLVDGPFAVINADDYYGKSAFLSVAQYLQSLPEDSTDRYCLAGFVLKNTLSENGGVTRGICQVNRQGQLTRITETKNIRLTPNGVEADGELLEENDPVSMNLWGFTPDFFDRLAGAFGAFLEKNATDPTAEFLVPSFVGELLRQKEITVSVLHSPDRWFGMTYQEDIPVVMTEIATLIEDGEYEKDLYSDLPVVV